MTLLDDKWVDRIFLRLSTIFEERWQKTYGDPAKTAIYKLMWKSALAGLTADEIKRGIEASSIHCNVPTPIEFYHFCKSIKLPHKPEKREITAVNRAIARANLDKMKEKLTGRFNSQPNEIYV